MAEPTAQRLTRLLAMVAYLGEAGAVPLAELADHFGVTREQVLDDIDLLWVSGTPGYMPGDLLDFSADEFDGGLIRLTEDQGMAVPLRLSTAEAVALQVALASLARTASPSQRDVVERVLSKLAAASDIATGAVSLEVEEPPDAAGVSVLREAAATGHCASFHYVSAAGHAGVRTVEPWRVFVDGGTWYLSAWSLDAAEPRTFRLDRMTHITARAWLATHEADPSAGLSRFSELDAPEAVLILHPTARWMADEIPIVSRTDLEGGDIEVRLRLLQPAWLRQLVFSHPGAVEVTQPAWLREQLREDAAAALRRYTVGEPGHGEGER